MCLLRLHRFPLPYRGGIFTHCTSLGDIDAHDGTVSISFHSQNLSGHSGFLPSFSVSDYGMTRPSLEGESVWAEERVDDGGSGVSFPDEQVHPGSPASAQGVSVAHFTCIMQEGVVSHPHYIRAEAGRPLATDASREKSHGLRRRSDSASTVRVQ